MVKFILNKACSIIFQLGFYPKWKINLRNNHFVITNIMDVIFNYVFLLYLVTASLNSDKEAAEVTHAQIEATVIVGMEFSTSMS